MDFVHLVDVNCCILKVVHAASLHLISQHLRIAEGSALAAYTISGAASSHRLYYLWRGGLFPEPPAAALTQDQNGGQRSIGGYQKMLFHFKRFNCFIRVD